MALFAGGRHFCKMTHVENGRCITRRIHEITIQLPNGTVNRVKGSELPDSLTLNAGIPYAGQHTLDVLLRGSPPRLPSFRSLLSKRTQLLLVAFVVWVIFTIFVLASLSHNHW